LSLTTYKTWLRDFAFLKTRGLQRKHFPVVFPPS